MFYAPQTIHFHLSLKKHTPDPTGFFLKRLPLTWKHNTTRKN